LAYKLRRPEGHGQSRLFESTPTQLNLTANSFSNRTVKATDVEPGQALAYKLRRPEGHGQSRLFESTPTQLNLTANPFSNRTVKATDELSPYPQGDGTLNSATASIRPSPQAELRAHIVTGSIAAVTAITLLLGTLEARTGLQNFKGCIIKQSKAEESKPEAKTSDDDVRLVSFKRAQPIARRKSISGVKPPRPRTAPNKHVKKRRDRPKVCFGMVHTRVMQRGAGASSVCSSGPPLGLSCVLVEELQCTVDEHHERRMLSGLCDKDFYGNFGHVTASDREACLLEAGVDQAEVSKSEAACEEVNWQRQESNEGVFDDRGDCDEYPSELYEWPEDVHQRGKCHENALYGSI